METLKVGTKSNPNKVAGALANVIREKDIVEVQAPVGVIKYKIIGLSK